MKKQCNRCGEAYRSWGGGKFELKHGEVTITATLCSECYREMREAYDDA